jgi:hypothetical protein
VLTIAGVWASLSFDVIATNYGLKGDEATYVSMAMSIADDLDVSYQRADLERFWQAYGSGPEGIFLKRGARVRLQQTDRFPFVAVEWLGDSRNDRLYFGKALIYPLAVAPFVRVAGLNGFWLFHVLLLGGILLAGFCFLSARSPDLPAFLFTLAFIGASITPLYGVYLGPDFFNFALVFFAYFAWLYKEVAVEPATTRVGRSLRGPQSDYLAVLLLGMATYSKPLFILLAGPLVLSLWWHRRWWAGLRVGIVYVAVVVGFFTLHAAITGEMNYQGGDRKTFYGTFPFESPDRTFQNTGLDMTTNDPGDALQADLFWPRFGHNLVYFFAGRHFGFALYCFPGIVVLAMCLRRLRSLTVWQVTGLLAFFATAIGLLVMIPVGWSGAGGPIGNRYFIPTYAVLLFCVPPFQQVGPALVAWIGGTLFTGHILLTPFASAKETWAATERGAARLFPVELTQTNDLPVELNPRRSRVRFGDNEEMLLYLLDENSFTPEPSGMWIAGDARADILVRVYKPPSRVMLVFNSPIANTVHVRTSGMTRTAKLEPGSLTTLTFRPTWVMGPGPSYGCVLSISTEHGFVPRLTIPESTDGRFLGVLIERLSVS